MSRAVVFDRYGGPDVLHVIDTEAPYPEPGQLRVAVKAAGVQPFDALFRSGAAHSWVPATFPQRLGNEFAEVEVRLVDTRNGQRLEIRSRRLGKVVRLCPVELESLTWQTPRWYSSLLSDQPAGDLRHHPAAELRPGDDRVAQLPRRRARDDHGAQHPGQQIRPHRR